MRFKDAQIALKNKYALIFGPTTGAEAVSKHIANTLYTPLAQGYLAIGGTVSRSLSLVSKDLGKRVEKGWTDPFSSSLILNATALAQRILTPIASSRQWDYPILRPISQTIIGLARFSDITLKDASTILEMPARATKIFTPRPWEAFISDHKILTGKATTAVFFAIYGICWFVIRIVDVNVRFFQAIAYKIQAGRRITDTARAQVVGVEKKLRSFFIENIEVRETQVRKKLVGSAASAMTKKILNFGASTSLRLVVGFGVSYLLSSQIRLINSNNNLISQETERTIVYLVGHAIMQSFVTLNLIYKTHAYAAFFKEFMKEVEPTWDPSQHTLFYRKNLITSAIKLNKIKKQTNKLRLNNKV